MNNKIDLAVFQEGEEGEILTKNSPLLREALRPLAWAFSDNQTEFFQTESPAPPRPCSAAVTKLGHVTALLRSRVMYKTSTLQSLARTYLYMYECVCARVCVCV